MSAQDCPYSHPWTAASSSHLYTVPISMPDLLVTAIGGDPCAARLRQRRSRCTAHQACIFTVCVRPLPCTHLLAVVLPGLAPLDASGNIVYSNASSAVVTNTTSCPAGYYCAGGQMPAAGYPTACSDNLTSPAGANSSDGCSSKFTCWCKYRGVQHWHTGMQSSSGTNMLGREGNRAGRNSSSCISHT